MLEQGLWAPALGSLRAGMPDDARRSTFSGTVASGERAGSIMDVGERGRPRGLGGPRVLDDLDEVARLTGSEHLGVLLTAHDDGVDEVTIWRWPPSVRAPMFGHEIALVGEPSVVPDEYAVEAVPGRGLPPSFSIDPAAVVAEVRTRGERVLGVPEAALDGVGASLGVDLPPDVRAMYREMGSGRVAPADGGRPGFDVVPLDHPFRDLWLAGARFPGWGEGGERVVCLDDRVQAVAGSPLWFVFGRLSEGDALAVDLAPGPAGRVGQVLHLMWGQVYGATVVADSLTDVLVSPPLDPAGIEHVDAPGRLIVHRRSGTTVADAHRPDVLEVQVGAVVEPVDLSPLAGHPRLRSLSAMPASVTGVDVVAGLASLRHLSLGRDDWRRLLDDGRVPPGLVAAGVSTFGEADVGACLGIANELLAWWGAPRIEPRSTLFPTSV